LVFTDLVLTDGKWQDVVRLAADLPIPVNTVVVSRVVDVTLYLESLEAGAYDFIAPPFAADAIAHVARCALENARQREASRACLERLRAPALPSPLLHHGI